MQEEIDKYMAAGQASFSVSLLMDSPETWELTTFTLRRSNYQIKINRTQNIFIDEKYSSVLSIKIPSGLTSQFVLTRLNGSSHPFTFHDVRMRDTFVLTMRMFQSKVPFKFMSFNFRHLLTILYRILVKKGELLLMG
ncbi:hypothetical protein HanOQP8_Chr01g0022351 [Helianthus annuus]|nr:hypothetical protein HanOQP8_Chr01g0022351 [Helianthus annuus]